MSRKKNTTLDIYKKVVTVSLMKLSYIARQTIDLPGTSGFKSWGRVVNSLEKAYYNSYEIEAIAQSKDILTAATRPYGNKAPYTALLNYLKDNDMAHGSKKMYALIYKVFGKSDKLELNADGIPCHRGTMPGNYHPNKTILVPVGTPRSCDPTSELYWSM
jgi:hypothetical protein